MRLFLYIWVVLFLPKKYSILEWHGMKLHLKCPVRHSDFLWKAYLPAFIRKRKNKNNKPFTRVLFTKTFTKTFYLWEQLWCTYLLTRPTTISPTFIAVLDLTTLGCSTEVGGAELRIDDVMFGRNRQILRSIAAKWVSLLSSVCFFIACRLFGVCRYLGAIYSRQGVKVTQSHAC